MVKTASKWSVTAAAATHWAPYKTGGKLRNFCEVSSNTNGLVDNQWLGSLGIIDVAAAQVNKGGAGGAGFQVGWLLLATDA